jgi:hypothetical protein
MEREEEEAEEDSSPDIGLGGEKTEIPHLNPARRSTSKKKIKEKEEIRTPSTQDLESKQMASKVRLALTSSGAVAGEDVRR